MKIQVKDLRAGMMVDLYGDKFMDPNCDPGETYEYEYGVVENTTRETSNCTVVDFENYVSCGFPPDHLVDVVSLETANANNS